MALNDEQLTLLKRNGYYIGGNVARTAHVMVAGKILYLGKFESYLDAQNAVKAIKSNAEQFVEALRSCGPAMMRG
ncbi:hypothetical protein SLURMMXVI_10051 [Escherichia phage vB_Eco_SLUR63]|nr:hypothetical protein SLURMMXVI_140028 [Escherichia phage vB_Eco_SLUR25]VAY27842.1 hypothetical protein SLURMMXVI_10051 [Escherichia phage vB_Eco_SLUR63]